MSYLLNPQASDRSKNNFEKLGSWICPLLYCWVIQGPQSNNQGKKKKMVPVFCLLWEVTEVGQAIRSPTGKSGASYLFHGTLTRSDSYSSGLAFCGLLENHENFDGKNDCITNELFSHFHLYAPLRLFSLWQHQMH